jgi:hypothetical protein
MSEASLDYADLSPLLRGVDNGPPNGYPPEKYLAVLRPSSDQQSFDDASLIRVCVPS